MALLQTLIWDRILVIFMEKWSENLKISNPLTAFRVDDPLIRTEHIATMFIRCITLKLSNGIFYFVIHWLVLCCQTFNQFLPYSSKFLWSNIFMFFVNYVEFTKIFTSKISLQHPWVQGLTLWNHEIMINHENYLRSWKFKTTQIWSYTACIFSMTLKGY